MKDATSRVEHEPIQGQDEAPEDGKQIANHLRELIEMRFLLSETLSIRCECYLSADAWLYLKDSPELRNIARKAIERIASEYRSMEGKNDEKTERRE